MSKPSRVIFIVEDELQGRLIYRYLLKRGLGRHDLREKRSPSGRGSAENWVRETFVTETNEYRRRQTRAQSALVVMIDADARSVQDRWNQLDQALRDNDEAVVGRNERIARLVPKRNVETWILCLNEQDVNESADYSEAKRNWNKLIPQAGETLSQWTQSKNVPPSHCVSSLRIGVRELKRLRF